MKNRIAIVAILSVMFVGAIALNAPHATKHVFEQVARAIEGNSTLEPAPSTYTVLCYPANWKSDPISQQLQRDLAKPGFKHLLHQTTLQTYVDGDAGFEHRFQSDSNSGPVSKLPAVLVMRDGKQIYKRSGADVKYAANEVGKIADCCPFRPHPEPKPEPTPAPNDRPVVPDTPETPDTPVVTDAVDPLRLALCLAVGGFIGWAVMFRKGTLG